MANMLKKFSQFASSDYQPSQAFLPDTEYSLALDCLTKAVSDVLVFNHDQSKILLGKRKKETEWWFIGGRARPGETTKEAAARNMKREIGVALSATRFKVVGHFSLLWDSRDSPQENTLADISTVHVCTLTESEQGSMQMQNNDYDSTEWYDWTKIRKDVTQHHPALKQAIDDWATSRIYDDLKEYCNQPDCKDEVIARMAKSLVGRRGEVEEVSLVHFHTGTAEVENGVPQMPWQKYGIGGKDRGSTRGSTAIFGKVVSQGQREVDLYKYGKGNDKTLHSLPE